jgi:hypothetical protein
MPRIRSSFVLLICLGALTSTAVSAQAPRRDSPRDSSVVEEVKGWTNQKWNAAKREWAKDKRKWADCRRQAQARKLSGRENWSFHYRCMKA